MITVEPELPQTSYASFTIRYNQDLTLQELAERLSVKLCLQSDPTNIRDCEVYYSEDLQALVFAETSHHSPLYQSQSSTPDSVVMVDSSSGHSGMFVYSIEVV